MAATQLLLIRKVSRFRCPLPHRQSVQNLFFRLENRCSGRLRPGAPK
jgi:hypothetical protein